MNNIYRVIWNASMNVWQAVSEIGRSGGKTQSVREAGRVVLGGQGAVRSFAATALMMACAMAHATPPTSLDPLTLPVISSAVGKEPAGASIDSVVSNNTMTIQAANKAVLNWASFSVGKDMTVQFIQPDAKSIALNRVIGSGGPIERSLIDGKLLANGNIFLINPSGITFAKGAQVNVGGIVASTRDITDDDFLAGTYKFKGDSIAEIRNEGQISATATGGDGYVVMIAAKIINAVNLADKDTPLDADKGGRITGKNVILVAGDEVLLEIAAGVPAIKVTKETEEALIHNGGWIYAADSRVLLTAPALEAVIKSAINNSGVIEAGSISMVGDVITLDVTKVPRNAADDGDSLKLEKSQLIATSPKVDGAHSIELSGSDINVAKDAELSASHATDASIKLSAKGNISNAGSISTGTDGAAGTVDMTALGEIKNAASGVVKSGAITLDGTTIKLQADTSGADVVKSQLIATTGPVNLKAVGAISNDGLIQSAAASASDAPSISVAGDSVELGQNSQLLATDAAASIKVTAAMAGSITNAGSIITGNDGATGTVVMMSGGEVKNTASGLVKSGAIGLVAMGDITLEADATDPDAIVKSQLIATGPVVLMIAPTGSGSISNNGLIQSAAASTVATDELPGPSITMMGNSITLGQHSLVKASDAKASIQLKASTGDISNGGSIITGIDGDAGTVELTSDKGSVVGEATSKILSGTITLDAGKGIALKGTGFLATNYSYTVVDGKGTILAKEISAVALNPANTVKKVYDGTSTANLAGLLDFTFTGLVAGESMSVGNGLGQYGAYRDGVFVASKNVQDVNLVQVTMNNPTYTMGTGTLASNYLLPTVIKSEMTGQITPRQLLATATAEDKMFDGKLDAKAVISFAKGGDGTGLVGNDQVSLGFRSAEFSDSQVGVNKKVFLRNPFAQGADSANYVVSFDGEFPAKDVTTEAAIRPLNLSPVVIPAPSPAPMVPVPPNLSNGPVQSIGGMGVVNVESSAQTSSSGGEGGGMTAVTIESLLANQTGSPNQVYVVDGGIKFEKSDN